MGGAVYDERPWLARYAEGQPADIEPDHDSALAMFGVTAARWPDAVAIHYRHEALTHAELDELSGAFAAALADHPDRPGPRRGRRRLPDLHLGHHRSAQGRDEHARQRRLQLADLDD